MKLHTEILPENQHRVFNLLAEQKWLHLFYMAGGTCLALQIGHRQSIDFDLFTQEAFNPSEIAHKFKALGNFEIFDQTADTLNGALDDVRISFFQYGYPLLESLFAHKNLKLARIIDIALMKIEAIAGRGNKKDFVDLYFILKKFTISKLFQMHSNKFGFNLNNHYHLLKSLVYFEDAEMQPMPFMTSPISWEEIKIKIIAEVTRFQKENAVPK